MDGSEVGRVSSCEETSYSDSRFLRNSERIVFNSNSLELAIVRSTCMSPNMKAKRTFRLTQWVKHMDGVVSHSDVIRTIVFEQSSNYSSVRVWLFLNGSIILEETAA